MWTTKLRLVPGRHNFKLLRECSDGAINWEAGPSRQLLVPQDGAKMEVECVWGEAASTQTTVTERRGDDSDGEGAPGPRSSGASASARASPVTATVTAALGRSKSKTEVARSNIADLKSKTEQLKAALQASPSPAPASSTPAAATPPPPAVASPASPSAAPATTSPMAAAPATTSPATVVTATPASAEPPPACTFVAAATMLPHIEKRAKGGEDAFFVCTRGLGAIGVADGVSGWAEEGVNPADYSRLLARHCQQALAMSACNIAAQEVSERGGG